MGARTSELLEITRDLSDRVDAMRFDVPVTHVYNPLAYAWDLHRQYIERFGDLPGRVVLVGMNPGPWGMVQTGVPFGEIAAVRDWMGIRGEVGQPRQPHEKRPVQGLSCPRSEVSGRRLWGWAAERFGTPEAFFERFYVLNHCPLVFMEQSGRNRTPDKLPAAEREPLVEACDRALRAAVLALQPSRVVGVGAWAEQRAASALDGLDVPIGRVLHPSPASPIANRGWAERAEADLRAQGIALP